VDGRVILYADRITGSMERAMAETDRRREKQVAYNLDHGITPQTIRKNIDDVMAGVFKADTDMVRVTARVDTPAVGPNLAAHLDAMRQAMRKAAENLEFEEAARLRDEVRRLEAVELAVSDDPMARQSAVEDAVEASSARSGRSTGGRGGMRGGKRSRGGRR
jgi:excinuclease ABC subunit B